MERIKNEPALVTAFVVALLACAVSFGLPITTEQQASVVALVTAALAVCGVATRQQVTPARTTHAETDASGVTVAGPASDLPDGTPVDIIPTEEPVVPERAAYPDVSGLS